jgi:hypothetical protein
LSKVILIHGNGGGTAGDIWFPWLERRADRARLGRRQSDLPGQHQARAKIWLPSSMNSAPTTTRFSSATRPARVAAMRYAETHRIAGRFS